MPIYQYACRSCGHSLEALRKISDEPLKICPNCNKPELAKQLTAAAFRLKGTGWYETDFKNSGKKPDSKTDSSNKKPDDSGEKVATSSGDTKSSGSDSGTSASSTSST